MAERWSVFLVGAGGMAREAFYIIDQLPNLHFEGYLVEDSYKHLWGKEITGGKILGPPSLVEDRDGCYYVAIGDTRARERIISEIGEDRLGPALVAPRVHIHPSTSIQKGAILCGGVQITVDIRIGLGAIINAGCFVGHDVEIGRCAICSPLASVAGNVRVGRRVSVGTGAAIVEKTTIADDAIIGAGAVVVHDITEPGTYVGVPARRVQR